MLRKALVLGLALSSGLAGPLVAVAAGTFFEEPPAVAGAPFSAVATMQSVTAFADGNRIVRTNTVRYFRDGQGRTRTERGDGPNRMILINDPVGGERYFVRPENKTVFASKMSAGSTAAFGMAPSTDDDIAPFALLGFGMNIGAAPTTESSSETTSLGQKSIDGLTATGTRLVRTIPSSVLGNDKPITSTLERWVSPDLGIAVQISQKSSIGGTLTMNLGQVTHNEPDSTLFSPPPGYTRHDINLPAKVASMVPMAPLATITAVKAKD